VKVPHALSAVEQALVSEVAAWLQRTQAEAQASADTRLAPILDAHQLKGQPVTFHHDGEGWVLLVEVEDTVRPTVPQLVTDDPPGAVA
jgi:hypothetical protein